MPRGDRLPDDFGFDDFLAALDAVDSPDDDDLATDDDGCVEVVTLPATEVAATLGRLREAGLTPHVEMPEPGEPGAMASVFVVRDRLALARAVLGIAR